MDLFPELTGLGAPMETVTNKTEFSTPKEPETAQMTISYADQVHVFDNLTREKAKEIIMLASKASACKDKPNIVAAGNNLTQELPQWTPELIASYRNAVAISGSLRRFVGNRNDKVNPRAPYQINQGSSSASVPDKTWLGLAPPRND